MQDRNRNNNKIYYKYEACSPFISFQILIFLSIYSITFNSSNFTL